MVALFKNRNTASSETSRHGRLNWILWHQLLELEYYHTNRWNFDWPQKTGVIDDDDVEKIMKMILMMKTMMMTKMIMMTTAMTMMKTLMKMMAAMTTWKMRRHGSDGRRAASQAIAGEVGDWSKKEGLEILAQRWQNWKFQDGTRRDPGRGAGQGADYCLVPENCGDDDVDTSGAVLVHTMLETRNKV